MKKIVLTGGGTAGHVTPNIALIPELQKEGWEISYVGTENGIEHELIEREGIPFYSVRSGKLRRYLSKENIKDAFRVIGGISDAKKVLKEINPDVVFSKGGFVAVPVVIAAGKLKIPVVAHESDMTPGLLISWHALRQNGVHYISRNSKVYQGKEGRIYGFTHKEGAF